VPAADVGGGNHFAADVGLDRDDVAGALRLRMPLDHRRASNLRRPQSPGDRPMTFVPIPLRTARRTTRFVCGRHEARSSETADS
jgi:hypothetical protein